MNTVKVYCKVVAHVVIPMDRMYNGRAATMNTIASGSLMRWDRSCVPTEGCGYAAFHCDAASRDLLEFASQK